MATNYVDYAYLYYIRCLNKYHKSVDKLLALSTVLEARASDGGSINGSIDASDSKQSTEHTRKALTGHKTCGNREHVHVNGRWALLHPKVVEDGSENHSDREGSLWKDEALHCVMER